jgi:hypothetical protein
LAGGSAAGDRALIVAIGAPRGLPAAARRPRTRSKETTSIDRERIAGKALGDAEPIAEKARGEIRNALGGIEDATET